MFALVSTSYGVRKVPAFAALAALALCTHLSAADQELFRAAAETNVNRRYTVETISIAGVRFEQAKLPTAIRRRIVAMVGARVATSPPLRILRPTSAKSSISARSATTF